MRKTESYEKIEIGKPVTKMTAGAGIDDTNRPFEMKKTFGLGVLLKLTQKNVQGIKIATVGNHFVSNVSFNRLKHAVECTMESHNIRVKV